VFHGSAGNPQDAHYDDQSELWCRGEMVPMRYGWDSVAQHAVSMTVLTPER
jgi:penicillin amidase